MKLRRICPICGAEFSAARSHGKQKTCGKTCGNILRVRSRVQNYAANPKPRENLTDMRFNRLIARRYLGRNIWECECECGNVTSARGVILTSGGIKSCGCLLAESSGKRAREHAKSLDAARVSNILAGKLRATNTSGATGVRLRRTVACMTYQAFITVNGKTIYLGTYKRFDDALNARKKAEQRYFASRAKPPQHGEEK